MCLFWLTANAGALDATHVKQRQLRWTRLTRRAAAMISAASGNDSCCHGEEEEEEVSEKETHRRECVSLIGEPELLTILLTDACSLRLSALSGEEMTFLLVTLPRLRLQGSLVGACECEAEQHPRLPFP